MRGTAAGVPYVAVPPDTDRPDAPVVVAWHLNDAPRTEVALAAALPLAGLDAWRVYLGLPLTGEREPAGGSEQLGYEDAVLKMFGPEVFGAAEEFPAAWAALQDSLGLGGGRLGLLGGSVGSLVAQEVATQEMATRTPVDALVLVSPVAQLRTVVAANERIYDVRYEWGPESDAVAARLDFVARAAEITAPALLVVGEKDDREGILDPAAALHAALPGSALETVPGMGHAFAEQPGVEAAPQTADAATIDRLAVDWFRRHLG